MEAFQICTIVGLILTAGISIYNLLISIRGQRKSQRELIFQKQFDFFMKLQSIIAHFEDAMADLNQSYSEEEEVLNRVSKYCDEFDMFVTGNEIIIPDELFGEINDMVIYFHNISKQAWANTASINKQVNTDITNKTVSLSEDIRDYLGIEKLSYENKKRAHARV